MPWSEDRRDDDHEECGTNHDKGHGGVEAAKPAIDAAAPGIAAPVVERAIRRCRHD